jgi:Transposase IS66 family/IS66 C-terminal element
LQPWLREKLSLISQKTKLAEAIRYALSRWAGLSLFLDDGQIEIDNNIVERAIRPLALNRKNPLFAGSDGGAEHWAVIASLIETCKLLAVEPHGYLADVITHPQRSPADPPRRPDALGLSLFNTALRRGRGLRTTLTSSTSWAGLKDATPQDHI